MRETSHLDSGPRKLSMTFSRRTGPTFLPWPSLGFAPFAALGQVGTHHRDGFLATRLGSCLGGSEISETRVWSTGPGMPAPPTPINLIFDARVAFLCWALLSLIKRLGCSTVGRGPTGRMDIAKRGAAETKLQGRVEPDELAFLLGAFISSSIKWVMKYYMPTCFRGLYEEAKVNERTSRLSRLSTLVVCFFFFGAGV